MLPNKNRENFKEFKDSAYNKQLRQKRNVYRPDTRGLIPSRSELFYLTAFILALKLARFPIQWVQGFFPRG